MSKKILDRREFLRSASRVAATVAVISGVPTILAANGAWAMSLSATSAEDAGKLLRMARLLYPHDALGDLYYATVVEELDAKAAKDAGLAETLKAGTAELDRAQGVPWLQLSEGTQIEVLRAMEGSPFFQAVRSNAVVSLYNNKLVWPNFGYQGSSHEHGGYLLRGFQDAGWTLAPDAEASPPAFSG
jgi:hypothetical protein